MLTPQHRASLARAVYNHVERTREPVRAITPDQADGLCEMLLCGWETDADIEVLRWLGHLPKASPELPEERRRFRDALAAIDAYDDLVDGFVTTAEAIDRVMVLLDGSSSSGPDTIVDPVDEESDLCFDTIPAPPPTEPATVIDFGHPDDRPSQHLHAKPEWFRE